MLASGEFVGEPVVDIGESVVDVIGGTIGSKNGFFDFVGEEKGLDRPIVANFWPANGLFCWLVVFAAWTWWPLVVEALELVVVGVGRYEGCCGGCDCGRGDKVLCEGVSGATADSVALVCCCISWQVAEQGLPLYPGQPIGGEVGDRDGQVDAEGGEQLQVGRRSRGVVNLNQVSCGRRLSSRLGY